MKSACFIFVFGFFVLFHGVYDSFSDTNKSGNETYRNDAERGDSNAQLMLGTMFQQGRGVAKDDQLAMYWFRKAAEQGNVDAQFNLGELYSNHYASGNDTESRSWYNRLINFASSIVGIQDDKNSIYWYRKAAKQGHAISQYKLASVIADGIGTQQDDKEAVFWFRKSAEQGDPNAQFMLGTMFQQGRGVPKDDQQAASWFRKSAEQKNAFAQLKLGIMYGTGSGVPTDPQESLYWLKQSVENGNQDAIVWYRKAREQESVRKAQLQQTEENKRMQQKRIEENNSIQQKWIEENKNMQKRQAEQQLAESQRNRQLSRDRGIDDARLKRSKWKLHEVDELTGRCQNVFDASNFHALKKLHIDDDRKKAEEAFYSGDFELSIQYSEKIIEKLKRTLKERQEFKR
ncbi:MAG: SEL1-like repeat protein [Magnetococcales bacterium]|nr:SEL1-like repeat protein [Magnetococcales bacterium]